MRWFRPQTAVVLLFILCGSVAASTADDERTALRFYGGFGLRAADDFGRGLCGWLDLWEHAASLWGIEAERTGTPGGLSSLFGADVLFPLTNWLFFTMGAGQVIGTEVFRWEAGNSGGLIPEEQEVEISLRAVPVRAGFWSRIPLSDRLHVSLAGGVAYYALASAAAAYRRDWQDYGEEDRFDLKSSGLGYDGGLGCEIRLSRRFSVILEGQYRRARLKKFTGTLERTSSEGGRQKFEGTLYSLDYGLGDVKVFPVIDVLPEPPVGPAFSRAGEAVVDFGGMTLVAGLLVRL